MKFSSYLSQDRTESKPQFDFYINEEVLEAIRIAHNWKKKGFRERLAEHLKVTRQNIDKLLDRKMGCSTDIMGAFIKLCGLSLDSSWSHVFEVKESGKPINHPYWNNSKYEGETPYLMGTAYFFRHGFNDKVELFPESKDQKKFNFFID